MYFWWGCRGRLKLVTLFSETLSLFMQPYILGDPGADRGAKENWGLFYVLPQFPVCPAICPWVPEDGNHMAVWNGALVTWSEDWDWVGNWQGRGGDCQSLMGSKSQKQHKWGNMGFRAVLQHLISYNEGSEDPCWKKNVEPDPDPAQAKNTSLFQQWEPSYSPYLVIFLWCNAHVLKEHSKIVHTMSAGD